MAKKRPVNVQVTLREAKGDPRRMIRKFMKKVKKEKIIEAYRENMFYEKPSDRRRREKLKKKENARKAERERKESAADKQNRRK